MGYDLGTSSKASHGTSVHFSPLPPFDHRGQYFEKRLNGIKEDGYEMAVFTVDPRLLPKNVVLRVSTANGHRLTQNKVDQSAITRITIYSWDASDHRWKIVIYHSHVLEYNKPAAYVNRAQLASLTIANVVSSDNDLRMTTGNRCTPESSTSLKMRSVQSGCVTRNCQDMTENKEICTSSLPGVLRSRPRRRIIGGTMVSCMFASHS